MLSRAKCSVETCDRIGAYATSVRCDELVLTIYLCSNHRDEISPDWAEAYANADLPEVEYD